MAQLPYSVLEANRGEIARRIVRPCQTLGVDAVAVYKSLIEGAYDAETVSNIVAEKRI